MQWENASRRCFFWKFYWSINNSPGHNLFFSFSNRCGHSLKTQKSISCHSWSCVICVEVEAGSIFAFASKNLICCSRSNWLSNRRHWRLEGQVVKRAMHSLRVEWSLWTLTGCRQSRVTEKVVWRLICSGPLRCACIGLPSFYVELNVAQSISDLKTLIIGYS